MTKPTNDETNKKKKNLSRNDKVNADKGIATSNADTAREDIATSNADTTSEDIALNNANENMANNDSNNFVLVDTDANENILNDTDTNDFVLVDNDTNNDTQNTDNASEGTPHDMIIHNVKDSALVKKTKGELQNVDNSHDFVLVDKENENTQDIDNAIVETTTTGVLQSDDKLIKTKKTGFFQNKKLSGGNDNQNTNLTPAISSPQEDTAFKKKLKAFCKRYFIDAFSGMAQGLFCTLIIGTIIKQLGVLITKAGTGAGFAVGNALIVVGNIASLLMGAGIGVGIAKSLKSSNLVIFSAIVAGMVGSFSMNFVEGAFWANNIPINTIFLRPGNPIGAYVCSVLACEIGNLVSGKTKIDIILVPFVVVITSLISIYIAWPFVKLIDYIGIGIAKATAVTPAVMGIIISVSMGILLTMPTSSAAIWIAIATPILTNPASSATDVYSILLAGGAAVVGCSCHMVGFAVTSYRENGVGGLIAQGIGTSMIQIPNIMRKPIIMLPEIIASFILGPISTCGFKLLCGSSGGGMGTSGLVGVIDTITQSTAYGLDPALMWCGVIFLMFVFPAIITLTCSEIMRKLGWIKFGDMKLDNN